jgi:RNA polymerase sigma-70 factor, ECF subfamily
MTPLVLSSRRRAELNITSFRLEPRLRSRPLEPAPIARQPGSTFEADLVAQLPVLRCYARKLTHDRERALDLVQDTCERALRFRHLFREGTSLRAWLLTVMRHHFLDIAKRTRDAMVSGKGVPLAELSEAAYSDARAEQICFVKEALALAGKGLSEEQASAFSPTLAGATLKECAAPDGVPKKTMATRLHRARSVMRRACAAQLRRGLCGAQRRSQLEHG